mmetsp:Transcript_72825/g.109869  ORF Transcript_72825/g.109869 Transcript_72825/m.109869 type:complete len:537 (+) Transcript_72825:43-1653(+)|eukprot:CAMPEP_0117013476 /NCGR_PEP_ID=MMETSP0472-20121206/11113_1 /TAXON_ID=693140 ORGANISM="Tiarina fusus, Strain LIS" /NCGR_SAMPLE_ID=MMETSP0472 /ASSEMBLY_ACC=CAM_ASM_000603 /LENGTH=536 /DNA_ID=CAMNT_0004716797 /DNA_START=39 /DNA_END=1649 /DNA_ORIENTATION=-
MEDTFFFGLTPHKFEDTFLDVIPNSTAQMYPVIHYYEQLYLEHALIVATHTVWKFMVTEDREAFANTIQVDVNGNFEPFNETHSVTIAVNHCQSAEEFETLSKARRVINDVPTWKAYHLPPVYGPDHTKQNSTYCIVLSKPQKWGSQMMPVTFYFRGGYSNRNGYWEKYSSPAIMLTNSASKWYEKAFITLALLGVGYDPKAISKPDAFIRWEDFITVTDLHMVGATGCRRKLSDNISFLSRFHLESLASMVQCEDGRVTLKKVRHFCNESSDGTPPLKLIEGVINRYRQSWESGAIVGIIRSGVVKQYLLEQKHPAGSFVLRIQYNSPSEICASSVQVNPQSGIAFVDHLTISQHVAPDDHKLQDYLACSPIHKIMLPMQAVCSRPAGPTSLEPSQTYRTTDQELQRTNQLLQQAYKEGFQATGRDSPNSQAQMSPTAESMGFGVPSPQSPAQSPAPYEQVGQLDEQVRSWLRYFFQNDSEQVFQEVAQKFVHARVTANSLHMLDAEDLKEMGIPLGPRKLLMRALQQLNSQYPR